MGKWVYAALIAVLLLAGGCGRSDDVPADATNAVAAYVGVSAEVLVHSETFEPLAMAKEGEPSEPAGFIRGLRSVSRRWASDGVYGWAVIFQSDITEVQRLNFESRARSLGLSVIWLNPDDRWPHCADQPECRRVRQSGAYP